MLRRLLTHDLWQRLFSPHCQWAMATLLATGLLLPFVALSFYSHPSLDDFRDAVMRQQMGFLGFQKYLYFGWTGRFTTSILLSELSPVYHGLMSAYWLVPILALIILLGSLYLLIGVLTAGTWPVRGRLLAAASLLSVWLLQASSIAEMLYWYNGVAVYTLPIALLLLWLVAVLRYGQAAAPAWGWLLASCVLGILVVGTNEPLALIVCGGSGLVLLWVWYQRSPKRWGWLLLTLLLAGALALSFLAPGNMARAQVIGSSTPLLWVLAGPAVSTAYLLLNWLSNGVLLACTVLALPVLWPVALSPAAPWQRWRHLHPIILAILLFGLLALAGVPSFWATAGLTPPRGRAMLFFLFVVAWFGLIVLTLARWQTPIRAYLSGLPGSYGRWPWPVALLLWAWLLVSFLSDYNIRQLRPEMGRGSNNVIVAYRDWLSGKGRQYHQQLSRRYQLLQTAPAARLQVPALTAKPATLLYYDISTDSTYWGNEYYAKYFGKAAVWTGPGGDAPPQ